jgi:hypothetical protein
MQQQEVGTQARITNRKYSNWKQQETVTGSNYNKSNYKQEYSNWKQQEAVTGSNYKQEMATVGSNYSGKQQHW